MDVLKRKNEYSAAMAKEEERLKTIVDCYCDLKLSLRYQKPNDEHLAALRCTRLNKVSLCSVNSRMLLAEGIQNCLQCKGV